MIYKTQARPWLMPRDVDSSHMLVAGEDGFCEEECKTIIKIGEDCGLKNGTVGPEGAVITEKRDSLVSWITPRPDTNWIFEKICGIVDSINKDYFQYDIDGIFEGFQFTKYSAPGGNFSAHRDSGPGIAVRKLSFTIQLSKPEEYDGGELKVYDEITPAVVEKKLGTFAVFPSFALHEVAPVTYGTRYSLVGWFSGPKFR